MRVRLAVIGAAAAAFAAPAHAHAADHVWLSVHTVRPADGWKLSAVVTSSDFDPRGGEETLGVRLEKRLSARAVELHALNSHHRQATIEFDGQQGRWRTAGAAGRSVAVDMAITATGAPQPVAPGESLPFACRGSFVRRLVTAHGTFVVRTGTAAFGTIRHVHLTGTVTYSSGGPVECGAAADTCESETSLSASSPRAAFVAYPSRRRLVVTFRGADGWEHVMRVSGLIVPSAQPPTIRIRAPSNTPAAVALTFVARETNELVSGPCRIVVTRGDLTGRMLVRFTGWGTRTFAAPTAAYRRP